MTIFQIKVYNKDGKLKKVVGKEKAENLFWSQFYIDGGDQHTQEIAKEHKKTRGSKKICSECNEKFYKTKKNTKYCSIKCKTKRNNRMIKKKLKPQTKRQCKIKDCTTTFITSGKQKYCSDPCRKEANRLKNQVINAIVKEKLKKIRKERGSHVG